VRASEDEDLAISLEAMEKPWFGHPSQLHCHRVAHSDSLPREREKLHSIRELFTLKNYQVEGSATAPLPEV
jgi:hypothetical protein